ncbi:hypothetical protein KI387_023275, partial [Taxus chinensis]
MKVMGAGLILGFNQIIGNPNCSTSLISCFQESTKRSYNCCLPSKVYAMQLYDNDVQQLRCSGGDGRMDEGKRLVEKDIQKEGNVQGVDIQILEEGV